MSNTFLIAGLGNPGKKYTRTRHNAGFWFLDELARENNAVFRAHSKTLSESARITVHGRDCLLLRPVTFVNHSGQAIRPALDYYQIRSENLLVAYDDLDLPPGTVRLKVGGGHGGHNGLRDIFQHIPDHGFLRLRIGIGHPGAKDAVTAYVLGCPPADEALRIRSALAKAQAVLPEVLGGHLPQAIQVLHTQEPVID